MFSIILLIGAISNRIRGGWLTDIVRELPKVKAVLKKVGLFGYKDDKKGEVYHVKDFNAIVFACIMAIHVGFNWDWTGLIAFVIMYGSIRLGAAMGWGGYITAMVDKKIDHERDDVLLFDKWFRGNDEPVLSGWAALSLRGLIWSISIYIGLICIKYLGYDIADTFRYISLIGLMMGTIYLVAIEICDKLTYRGNGWQWAELAFGSYYFGLSVYLS